MFSLFYCWRSSYCCFMTVFGPEFLILVSPGLYMLNTEVLEFCFSSKVTVVHFPNPYGSSPLVMIADDILSNAMMAVPLGV